MFCLAYKGRAHLECVFIGSGGADEDAIVAHGIDHIERQCPPLCRRSRSETYVDAEEQARVAYGVDGVVALGNDFHAGPEALTHVQRVFRDPVALKDGQHGVGRRDANGVSGKSIRVAGGGAELVHGGFSPNDRADRKAVAHRLSQSDKVRDDTMAFKAPHMRPGPAETRLDLVSDKEASGVPLRGHSLGDEAGRVDPDAVAGKDAVDKQGCDANAATLEVDMAVLICASKKSAAWASGTPSGPGRQTMRTLGLSLTASPRFGDTAATAALVP